jgi:hypothetical protein
MAMTVVLSLVNETVFAAQLLGAMSQRFAKPAEAGRLAGYDLVREWKSRAENAEKRPASGQNRQQGGKKAFAAAKDRAPLRSGV